MIHPLRSTLALCLLLGACATPPAPPQAVDQVPDAWPLLPPAALGRTVQVKQILHAAFAASTVDLQCALTVEPDRVTVVGLTPLGLRAFTIGYDGTRVDAQRAPQVPAFIDGARLLDDIQLVFWPLPALQAALAPAGWIVIEPFSGTRRLLRGDALIAEVHYAGTDPWSGRVWLVNFRNRYTLTIDTSQL
jgi:Protein of unknown function (DUF3261)